MAIGSGTAMGWGALLGFGEETTWGTKATATNFMEFASESFKKSIEEEKIESLGTGRAFARRVQKQVNVEGTLSYNLHPVDAVKLIKHALMGTVTSAQVGVTVAYNHTFTASDMSTLTQKGLSFEIKPDKDTTTAFYYTGCRVNSLKISGSVNEPIKAEASFVGRDATTGAFATTTAAYSPVRPFLFQDVTFRFDGSIASMTAGSTENIVSFELAVANNLQSDESARSLGNTVLTTLPPGQRNITLSFVQRYDTTTAFERFTQGTQGAVRMIFDTGQTIGAALTTYAMFIDLPKVYFNAVENEVGGAEILTQNVEVTVIGDTTTSAGNDITVSLTNSVTTYA